MRKISVLLAVAIAAAACDPPIRWDDAFVDPATETDLHGMIVLGDKLEDPFTVENMTRALESVYPTKASRIVMTPTDYYVRFLPTGEEQYDRLESMGISMLDHPVDYEILKEGDWYHDPDVEEGRITWQYAVVNAGFKFPGDIRYEILDECYIAENDMSTKGDGLDWEAVEREAFRLTGNGGMLTQTRADGSSGTPEGRIEIEDSFFGGETEGVRGVKVSCNSFVKFAHAYTDKDGNYRMSKSFSSKVRYRIVYKNAKGFAIGVNLIIVPASTSSLGSGEPSGKSVRIDAASERKLYTRSAVNNAAYDYYEKCKGQDGTIKTPPANLRIWIFQHLESSSAPMLQQGALVDNSFVTEYLGEGASILKMFLPDVTIGLKHVTEYKEIYSVTLHELSHASHFMQVGTDYWTNYINFILRSFITSGFVTYGVGTEKNSGYCEVGEMWSYFNESLMIRERYDNDYVSGTSYWFYPQIFLYMEERGISRYKIFAALTSDINSRDVLQKKLVSLYPEEKSMINQAFAKYQ